MAAETTDVTVTTVIPSRETPRRRIWLSNLDLVAGNRYTPTIYAYPGAGRPDSFNVEVLKTALANALVVFYPLAGRLSRDPETGRPEIDCSGQGVVFVTAKLDAVIDDFNDFVPSVEMRRKLVPATNSVDPPCAMLVMQVNWLRLFCF